jgi:hypothetical protein
MTSPSWAPVEVAVAGSGSTVSSRKTASSQTRTSSAPAWNWKISALGATLTRRASPESAVDVSASR